MTKTAETEPQEKKGRGRTIAVALLLIVACVLAPLSVLAVWTKNTLLDSDEYVSTVAPLAPRTRHESGTKREDSISTPAS